MKRSLRELSIDVAIHRGIFKNTQITLFPCFILIPKQEVVVIVKGERIHPSSLRCPSGHPSSKVTFSVKTVFRPKPPLQPISHMFGYLLKRFISIVLSGSWPWTGIHLLCETSCPKSNSLRKQTRKRRYAQVNEINTSRRPTRRASTAKTSSHCNSDIKPASRDILEVLTLKNQKYLKTVITFHLKNASTFSLPYQSNY